jgi:hypothetical protein
MMNFSNAVSEYKKKFGDTPTIINLNNERREAATVLLYQAIEQGKAIKDSAFFKALDIDLPEDALI